MFIELPKAKKKKKTKTKQNKNKNKKYAAIGGGSPLCKIIDD